MDTVRRLSEATGFSIENRDIDACHRLPRRRTENAGDPRQFIIKFVSRIRRTDFLIHCKEKKFKCDIFGGSSSKNLCANEHLTPATAELLGLARKLKSKDFRVETRDCSVFINSKDEPRQKITSKNQIVDILAREGIPFKL